MQAPPPQIWSPSRAAALEALEAFLPRVPRYAFERNFDRPGHAEVSRLSPFIRRRLVTEEEICQRVLGRFSFADSEKFLQEVCWRTYWKGYLAAQPALWSSFRESAARLEKEAAEAPWRATYEAALAGATSLACFNDWVAELQQTGYLHNHARMWFASTWIFTMKLPWELGALFMYRHLLDGDPASNTLSWRWVAGLHTRGKSYLARADNISKYSDGRWTPKDRELNESAEALRDDGLSRTPSKQPAPGPLADTVRPAAVLLHDEDCGPLPAAWNGVPAVRCVVTERRQHAPSQLVTGWVAGACADADARFGTVSHLHTAEELAAWCREAGVAELWTVRPHTGFVAETLAGWGASLAPLGISLQYADRLHDLSFFPLANRGFFPFWEAASATLRRQW